MYKSFRVHFSDHPIIEFSRIDDESLVGSLGYLEIQVTQDKGKGRFYYPGP
jgi:hypothetical protein